MGRPRFPALTRFQGHFVKSWKTRWFILQQDKLFYFKNRTVRVSLISARSERSSTAGPHAD